MDKSQLWAAVDYMIGFKSVGVAGDEELVEPSAPEFRAFAIARLGDNTPRHGYQVVNGTMNAKPFANLLREIADGIDPPTRGTA